MGIRGESGRKKRKWNKWNFGSKIYQEHLGTSGNAVQISQIAEAMAQWDHKSTFRALSADPNPLQPRSTRHWAATLNPFAASAFTRQHSFGWVNVIKAAFMQARCSVSSWRWHEARVTGYSCTDTGLWVVACAMERQQCECDGSAQLCPARGQQWGFGKLLGPQPPLK